MNADEIMGALKLVAAKNQRIAQLEADLSEVNNLAYSNQLRFETAEAAVEHNAKIGAEMTREAHRQEARAEELEAELAETKGDRDMWIREAKKDHDFWYARAEKAEAEVERLKERNEYLSERLLGKERDDG